jgi:6-phosphogluconolactonase
VCALSCVLASSCSDSSGDGGDPTDTATSGVDTSTSRDVDPGDTLATEGGKDVTTDTASGGDADATPPVETNKVLYVGGGDGKISLFTLDTTSGALTPSGDLDAGDYPSFLAFDVAHLHLFAVLESSNRVAAFSIAKGTGALTKLGDVASPGGPTHVSVDRTGKYAMVANYGGGTALVFSIGADGSLGAQTDSKSPGTNSHQIITDPSNAFAFVPNKGSDTVSQYVFDASKGTLTANASARLSLPAGSGPRHLAFHPDGKHAYLIDELNDTMTALSFDSSKGTLASIQTITTLPASFDPSKNTCAEVQIAPSGKFVYGSNRGHDSIVIYSVDAATGMLTLVGHEPTGGKTPRHFSIDDTGTFLFAANQASSNVVTFRIDPAKGTLTKLTTTTISSNAYFAAVAAIPK